MLVRMAAGDDGTFGGRQIAAPTSFDGRYLGGVGAVINRPWQRRFAPALSRIKLWPVLRTLEKYVQEQSG
jgi:hypothetical protein